MLSDGCVAHNTQHNPLSHLLKAYNVEFAKRLAHSLKSK
jgi:hypothetical protein